MDFISRFTAGLLAVALSPLLLGISIANLIILGRPIIFRQSRVGKNFKEFTIFKFRSIKNQLNNNNFATGITTTNAAWNVADLSASTSSYKFTSNLHALIILFINMEFIIFYHIFVMNLYYVIFK